MKRVCVMIGAISMLAAACGGNNVTQEEAQEGWATANQALVQGYGRAQAEVDTSGNSSGSATDVTVDWSCLQGGSATFTGTVNAASNSQGSSANVDFSVSFNGCTANGTTVDGNLNYVVNVNAGNQSASTNFKYDGKLNFSGDVNGKCVVDMQGSTSSSYNGSSYSGTVNYSGTLCGHNAKSTLNTGFSAGF